MDWSSTTTKRARLTPAKTTAKREGGETIPKERFAHVFFVVAITYVQAPNGHEVATNKYAKNEQLRFFLLLKAFN